MAIRSPEVLLAQAVERVDTGDVVSAGCYVREAIRRHLRNLCDGHHCRPAGRDETPRTLLTSLRVAGLLTRSRRRSLGSLVRVCEHATYLHQIRPNRIRRAIAQANALMVDFPIPSLELQVA